MKIIWKYQMFLLYLYCESSLKNEFKKAARMVEW